jgi:hypothetical protein
LKKAGNRSCKGNHIRGYFFYYACKVILPLSENK